MASPSAAIKILLASSRRVLQHQTTAQDLIAAYPSLKQKSLSSPSTLTDSERRVLLDLLDEDVETKNISAATDLSREQLIEKAVSNPASLTTKETVILKDEFWMPKTPEEVTESWQALVKAREALGELLANREPAYLPNELEAFGRGSSEYYRRQQAQQDDAAQAVATAALPAALGWIQSLYQQKKAHWGFICLYDAAVQNLDPDLLDDFEVRLDGFFNDALEFNGSKDIIDDKWRLINFNAPNTGFAPTAASSTDDNTVDQTNYHAGAIFRAAFQEILKDPQEYQKAKEVTAVDTPTQFKDGIAATGILTNTFLVIDPICVNSVLDDARWYNNMRVLAFEAEFPVEGRKYVAGYQGYTWVRLDQLVYNFYELRSMRAEVGMDEVWKAAQESRNRAFVSLDREEASNFSTSRPMQGFTRDSVLGKRWHAMKDARKEGEGNQIQQQPSNFKGPFTFKIQPFNFQYRPS